MNLYPKKLNGLAELQREKAVVRKELQEVKIEELFTMEGVLGKKNAIGEVAGLGMSLLKILPLSNPIVGTVAGIVMDRLMTRKSRAAKQGNEAKEHMAEGHEGDEKKEGGFLKRAIVELLGGYMKYKAAELSYKGVKKMIKKKPDTGHHDNE